MTDTRPEPLHVTSKRIWGVYYDIMEHFGVKSEDSYMAEFPIKGEGDEVVGVSQVFEFKSKAVRDKIQNAFQTANNTCSAVIEPKDLGNGCMPHMLNITTCGDGDELYFEMDRLTQSVAAMHLTAE